MKTPLKHLIPALTAVALTSTIALAQTPPANAQRGANRTPPTAEQMAERQAQMCADRAARAAAQFTYLEQRLQLTAAQKPLFDRWKTAVQSDRAAAQANCTTPRTTTDRQRPTLPERNAQLEESLKARLASLEKTRPSEEALYNALTDQQKQVFERRGSRSAFGTGSRMGMRDGARRGGPSGMGNPGMGGPDMGMPGGMRNRT